MTVKEIARLAGVSIGTVDRVLHARGEVSPETKERVEAIITTLGYQPNMIARHLSLNRSYVFTVLVPRVSQDSGYWALSVAGIRKAAEELSPFNITVRIREFDRYDRGAYEALAAEEVRKPSDGLLIAPVLPESTRTLLDRLPAGTPYVFFDGRVEGAEPLTTIGQDAFKSGQLGGRLMSLLVGPDRMVCAVSTHGEEFHIRKRLEGFLSYFGDARDGRVFVAECLDIVDRTKCFAFLDLLFRQYPGLSGLFIANTVSGSFAEYLVLRGLKDKVALIGYDLVPENIRNLRDGLIDCLISQRPEYQGYKGVYQLYRSVVLGQPCEREILMPLDIFFRENLQTDGDRQREMSILEAGEAAVLGGGSGREI